MHSKRENIWFSVVWIILSGTILLYNFYAADENIRVSFSDILEEKDGAEEEAPMLGAYTVAAIEKYQTTAVNAEVIPDADSVQAASDDAILPPIIQRP